VLSIDGTAVTRKRGDAGGVRWADDSTSSGSDHDFGTMVLLVDQRAALAGRMGSDSAVVESWHVATELGDAEGWQ